MEDNKNIQTPENYQSYIESIDKFNSSIGTVVSDIYNKISLLNGELGKLDKRITSESNKEYFNERLNKISGDLNAMSVSLNNTINGFNESIKKTNETYADTADKINKLNAATDSLRTNVNDISSNLTKTLENFNSVAKTVNMKTQGYAENVNRIEQLEMSLGDQFKVLNENYRNTVSALNASQNEISEKINKLSETVYAGLPGVNSLTDEINQIKKSQVEGDSKFEKVANVTNALTVEVNGLNLKIETVGNEFKNIQEGISGTQKHVTDFINMARGTLSAITTYNPEAVAMETKKNSDHLSVLDQEIEKMTDRTNTVSKTLSDLSGKISELSVVKNAGKLFDNVQSVSKNIEETENRVNAQTSKVEVMFNQINSSMNRIIDLNNKLNEVSKRLNELDVKYNKIEGSLALFATKDDLMTLNNKLQNQPKQ